MIPSVPTPAPTTHTNTQNTIPTLVATSLSEQENSTTHQAGSIPTSGIEINLSMDNPSSTQPPQSSSNTHSMLTRSKTGFTNTNLENDA
ncbi:hypothetical protein PIB30_037129 [Stylosanthes scabra]|uniref:Uncharacterized protein n=1 Tax=Stylosanthes scabra TaxID=79078 RepID=A0ABU6QED3_9FABA|nr:hypothetical protein [Stylosanthes scabra]